MTSLSIDDTATITTVIRGVVDQQAHPRSA
jgi:hypothetical protein